MCALGSPVALAERVKAKLVSNLSSVHSVGEILLVSKNKQNCIPQFILPTKNKKSQKPNGELIKKKPLILFKYLPR